MRKNSLHLALLHAVLAMRPKMYSRIDMQTHAGHVYFALDNAVTLSFDFLNRDSMHVEVLPYAPCFKKAMTPFLKIAQ